MNKFMSIIFEFGERINAMLFLWTFGLPRRERERERECVCVCVLEREGESVGASSTMRRLPRAIQDLCKPPMLSGHESGHSTVHRANAL